jgi:selenide,water dikinase
MEALTGLTVGGGCAAKYSAARLEELLQGFVPVEAENLLVGLAPADDAAVYKLDDERALVFTLDFFPPLVDDPAAFGRIAATNALNDVFAMGGTPLLALSIAAFPEELPTSVLGEVFAAAADQVRAAGGLLAGGRSRSTGSPSSAPSTRRGSGRRAARGPAMRSSSRSRSAPVSCLLRRAT